MIEKLIDEIYSALEYDLYFAALALALILPDSCAKAEFPTEQRNSIRYKKWYKKYIGNRSLVQSEFPDVDENVAYNLRCCFLHEGNPNVEEGYGIDRFELMFQKKDPHPDYEVREDGGINLYFKYFDTVGKYGEDDKYFYRINVRSYCEWICKRVREYYKENSKKFLFDYTIVDWEDVKPKT